MTTTLGKLFILSAPSGTGKTSLAKALFQTDIDLSLSVSYTSRSVRLGEVEGRDYYFVERKIFERMLLVANSCEKREIKERLKVLNSKIFLTSNFSF